MFSFGHLAIIFIGMLVVITFTSDTCLEVADISWWGVWGEFSCKQMPWWWTILAKFSSVKMEVISFLSQSLHFKVKVWCVPHCKPFPADSWSSFHHAWSCIIETVPLNRIRINQWHMSHIIKRCDSEDGWCLCIGVQCGPTEDPPYFRCGSCPPGSTGNGTSCHDLDEVSIFVCLSVC